MTRHSQLQLILLLHDNGPLTIRQISRIAYGRDEMKLRQMMWRRIKIAREAGLVEFSGHGERESPKGDPPQLWRLSY